MNAHSPIELVLTKLEGVSGGSSGKWTARCPAHDDRQASLSVTEGDDGRVLIKCFAGCQVQDVVAALGLEMGDLFKHSSPRREGGSYMSSKSGAPPQRSTSRNIPPEFRWPIVDANGEIVAVHRRQDLPDGKKMWWEQPDGTLGLNGVPVGELPLYNLPALIKANPGEAVVVAEGEKATDALSSLGILAVGTVTGANGTPCEQALHPLLGHETRLWPDAHGVGFEHMDRIAGRLMTMGHEDLKHAVWGDAPEGGDAADAIAQGVDVGELLETATPWHEQAEGAQLLDDIVAFIERYLVIGREEADAEALWAQHTHALEAADTTPYVNVRSVEKRSGKTRDLEVLELVVARPWLTGRVTAAVLARKVDKETPTLLLDESDATWNGPGEYAEVIRGVLNTGHRRGGKTSLCVGQGSSITYVDFSTFGPKAIAAIGKLPDTVSDRSIDILMRRRHRGEKVERFRQRDARAIAAPLHQRLSRWAQPRLNQLRDARPEIPEELDDRAADNWEPLLAIADAAGGDWPVRARRAAKVLSGDTARHEDESLGVRLLGDVRSVFGNHDNIASAELVRRLNALEESPWGDLKGKPLDNRRLPRLLKKYGVGPLTVRLRDGRTAKGYKREHFVDPWARYLPVAVTSVTSASSSGAEGETYPSQDLLCDGKETAPPPQQIGNVTDVTDKQHERVRRLF